MSVTVTVVPKAVLSGSWQKNPPTLINAASLWQAISNPSSSTKADFYPVTNNVFEILELDLSAIPANASLTSIQITYQHARYGHTTLMVRACGISADGLSFSAGPAEAPDWCPFNTWKTNTDPARSSLADGSLLSAWSRLGVILEHRTTILSSANYHEVHELRADVSYDVGVPSVELVGPSGIESGLLAEWVFAQPQGLDQSAYHLKTFPQALAFVSGFDPFADSGAVFDSGKVSSSADSLVLPQLDPGVWRTYVRVWALNANGQELVSSAVFSGFEVPLLPPLLPPGSVVASQVGGVVEVDVWGEGYDQRHAEALTILTDPASYWIDAADVGESDSVWVPRNAGPAAQPGEPRFVRTSFQYTGRARWRSPARPAFLTLDVGTVVECEFMVPEANIADRSIFRACQAANENRIGVSLDDSPGRSFYLVLSSGSVHAYPRSGSYEAFASPGDWVTVRAEVVQAAPAKAKFELSTDDGETWHDLGCSSSANLVLPTSAFEPSPTNTSIGFGYSGDLVDDKLDIRRITIDGVDWFDADRHSEPGVRFLGTDVPGGWWSVDGTAEVIGGAQGRLVFGSTGVVDRGSKIYSHKDGQHYVSLPGASWNLVEQAQVMCPSGTDDLDQHFRFAIPESVPDLNSIGGFWRDSGSISDGPGLRWVQYEAGPVIQICWKATIGGSHGGHWAYPGAEAGALVWARLRYRYDVGGSTHLYLDVSYDQVSTLAEVETWVEVQDADRGGLFPLAPSTSLPFSVGNRCGNGGIRNGIGKFLYASFIYNGGPEQGVFDPANQIDISADPAAGQMGWSGPDADWVVVRGGDAHQTEVVTRPAISVANTSGSRGLPLVPALAPIAANGYTVVIGGLIRRSQTAWCRVWSAEVGQGDGPNFSNHVTGSAQIYMGYSSMDGPTSAAFDEVVSSVALRLGDGRWALDTDEQIGQFSGPLSSNMEVGGTPSLGVQGYATGGRNDMTFSSLFVAHRRLSTDEVSKVMAAMREMSIAPIADAEACVRRLSDQALLGTESTWPQQPARIVDYQAAHNQPNNYEAKLRGDNIADSPWVPSNTVSPTVDRFWFTDPTGQLEQFSPDIDDGQWAPVEGRLAVVSRQAGASAVAVSADLGDTLSTTVRTMSVADRDKLDAYLMLGKWRVVDVHGNGWNIALSSEIRRNLVVAQATEADTAPIRDFYMTSFTMSEVKS